jgi:hypothetical protein
MLERKEALIFIFLNEISGYEIDSSVFVYAIGKEGRMT